MILRIATWNINSIRKRLHSLLLWLSSGEVDILLLQETRVEDSLFPLKEIEDAGYYCLVRGQKARNGVAIISKYPFVGNVVLDLQNTELKNEARYIENDILIGNKKISVASVYVPNGQDVESSVFQYKLFFLDQLFERVLVKKNFNSMFLIGGDFNVAPENIDVHSPDYLDGSVCFHLDERERFRAILNSGMVDLFRFMNDSISEFSWWDYRASGWQKNRGMRLDHLIASPNIADLVSETKILKSFRAEDTPSDHVPVISYLSI